MGADYSQIEGCINNMIGNTAGMICDGAKNGCAMKLSTSAAAAIQAVIVAMDGKSVSSIEGIVGASAEDTISNLGKLATEGMAFADKVIIDIMASK
jgi:L-cysteine desulfidase